jgi:predicted phosphodiesterase
MRLAIISDIHSNLEALQQALEAISEKNMDEIVCLGDIIGYGANPNECIELVREHATHVLLGNHDEAAVDLSKTEYFNPYARVAAEWTNQELSAEHSDFINELPYTLELDGHFFVHSSPFEPHEWHYVISDADAQFNFDHFTQPICFLGHSHVPSVFCDDEETIELAQGKRFIINVGSIGQPRDGDRRLSLGIVDTETWSYENLRLEYDVQKAADKIRQAGLPKALSERLFIGR